MLQEHLSLPDGYLTCRRCGGQFAAGREPDCCPVCALPIPSPVSQAEQAGNHLL